MSSDDFECGSDLDLTDVSSVGSDTSDDLEDEDFVSVGGDSDDDDYGTDVGADSEEARQDAAGDEFISFLIDMLFLRL